MNTIKVKFKNKAPEYKTKHAAGADIKAYIDEPITLKPFDRAIIPTGIYLELPENYEAQVRPRSGLAAKNGVTVLNTPGTIDSDYRGEVRVILINLGSENFVINSGDRIAQMVLAPVIQAEYIKVSDLNSTDRGHGGFGSTGI